MTNDNVNEVLNSVGAVHEATDKIHERFESHIEPELKTTQQSAYISKELVEILSKRITLLFSIMIILNVLTLGVVLFK